MTTKNKKTAAARRSERELLASARPLFAARGYDATSLRDIAAEAGVSPSLVLYHFQSKEQLFRCVVDELFESMHRTEALAVRATARLPLAERLYTYALARLQWCEDDADGMHILARLFQSSTARATVDLQALYRERVAVNDPLVAGYLATIDGGNKHDFFAATAALLHEAVYVACEPELIPVVGDDSVPPRPDWREQAAAAFVRRLLERPHEAAVATTA